MFAWLTPDPLKKLMMSRQKMEVLNLPEPLRSLFVSPLPDSGVDVRQLDALVIDFETSGFDPACDRVLSIGWVEIRQGVISLGSSHHILIRTLVDITADSSKVHHILPETLHYGGISEKRAFEQLLAAMVGKVVIAHGCVIEKGFLEHYIKSHSLLTALPLLWLDTLKIEQYRCRMRTAKPDWRLASVRKAYNLPDYPAHHALMDAIATAELFLAQRHALFGSSPSPLRVMMQASC